jgi:hypothetical protein
LRPLNLGNPASAVRGRALLSLLGALASDIALLAHLLILIRQLLQFRV